ncbi:MAG: NTP transferase domain-containing protein [Sphingobacteriales bacterium]
MPGIIILAAGSSGRLGSPKQNLIYNGQTLLQRAIETAVASACGPVIVVLGANENVIRQSIEDSRATIVYNTDWQEGMASSIRVGITALNKSHPKSEDVILILCDQPFVDTSLLNQLVQKKSAKGIIACAYNDTIGPPVLFDAAYFDELLLLKGQEGAKKLLMKYRNEVITMPFPLGSVDIDTAEDFARI